jgi:hypothetical protein
LEGDVLSWTSPHKAPGMGDGAGVMRALPPSYAREIRGDCGKVRVVLGMRRV